MGAGRCFVDRVWLASRSTQAMSESQYYEFRVVDRPLTDRQMAELRKLSTRAKITPTSFANVYNFGDFRGNRRRMMEEYFDAFVYVANWGTRLFMLRFPRSLLDAKTAGAYCAEDVLSLRRTGKKRRSRVSHGGGRGRLVTAHRPGTASFFGPFRPEKCACPLARRGGQSLFRGLRRENRDSPRERLQSAFLTTRGSCPTVCHRLEQAVSNVTRLLSTVCPKQWHIALRNAG
jgi:hypothetical protein